MNWIKTESLFFVCVHLRPSVVEILKVIESGGTMPLLFTSQAPQQPILNIEAEISLGISEAHRADQPGEFLEIVR